MNCHHGRQPGQVYCPSCQFEERQRASDRERHQRWHEEQQAASAARARAAQEEALAQMKREEQAAREAARHTAEFAALQERQRETERLLMSRPQPAPAPTRPPAQRVLPPQAPPRRQLQPPPRPQLQSAPPNKTDTAKKVVAVAAGLAAIGAAAAFFLSRARKGGGAGTKLPAGAPAPAGKTSSPYAPSMAASTPAAPQPRARAQTSGWKNVGSAGELGPVSFDSDGGFAYAGIRFDQGSSLESCHFGEATVNKRPGEGETLTIETAEAVHQLRYVAGVWSYRVERA
jgi:hypothetical protein